MRIQIRNTGSKILEPRLFLSPNYIFLSQVNRLKLLVWKINLWFAISRIHILNEIYFSGDLPLSWCIVNMFYNLLKNWNITFGQTIRSRSTILQLDIYKRCTLKYILRRLRIPTEWTEDYRHSHKFLLKNFLQMYFII